MEGWNPKDPAKWTEVDHDVFVAERIYRREQKKREEAETAKLLAKREQAARDAREYDEDAKMSPAQLLIKYGTLTGSFLARSGDEETSKLVIGAIQSFRVGDAYSAHKAFEQMKNNSDPDYSEQGMFLDGLLQEHARREGIDLEKKPENTLAAKRQEHRDSGRNWFDRLVRDLLMKKTEDKKKK